MGDNEGAGSVTVHRLEAGVEAGVDVGAENDVVAIEEPLELRLGFAGDDGKRHQQSISITMRTPGNDLELAAGFLFTEGIVASTNDIDSLEHCGPPVPPRGLQNVVRIELKDGVDLDLKKLERHFYTTSSCGVCGKTSLDALEVQRRVTVPTDDFRIARERLFTLPDTLTNAQRLFGMTGGIHASASFDADGKLDVIREDVGRHNALDKVIGALLLDHRLPAIDRGIVVSGRASFELLQKTMMAGCPMLAAVGAPSSLAIGLAERFDMTLAGFVRDGRANVYANPRRVA
ncbi:MAG: formate dehydrogenase accessory sulfurtransferase FdhD [Pseudomonadota bacterium]